MLLQRINRGKKLSLKRLGIFFGFFVLLLFFQALAWANEGHSEESFLGQLKWSIINFALFIAVIIYLYRKKIAPLVSKRSEKIAGHLEQAAAQLSEAEAKLTKLQGRLDLIEQERERLLVQYRDEAEEISRNILEHAKRDADKIVRDAERQIEREIEQTKILLQVETLQQLIASVREELQSSFSSEDDRLFRDKVLRGVLRN